MESDLMEATHLGHADGVFRRRFVRLFSDTEGSGPSLILQRFSGREPTHNADHLVFVDGRLVEWAVGTHPDVDAAIWHEDPRDQDCLLLAVGTHDYVACDLARLLIRDEHRWRAFECPPVHLARACLDFNGPPVPDADMELGVRLERTPFGTLDYSLTFESGRPVRFSPGAGSSPHVWLHCSLSQLVDFHSGAIDLPTMLQRPGVRLHGDWQRLTLAGGLIDSEPFRKAWLDHCPQPAARLAANLGELIASPPYQRVLGMSATELAMRWSDSA